MVCEVLTEPAPYAASGTLTSVEEARRFGRYRVTGTLGAGAMGEVFSAVDDVLGREVAVKTLKGHRNALAARMIDDRFRMEARAIAALAHPGVVAVFDIDLEADPPYLVMERVAGPSLKDRLAKGPLAVNEVRALGIQIARALAAAHERKIVHRDVKPANILAAGDGAWKLADFGVAHVPDSSLTMTGQFVGSPAYAAPEALVRGQSDAEGDVYGLGATLYQAASGRWPRLDAAPSGALIPPVPPVATFAPHLPPDIAAIIDRAVAPDPGARPSAVELADALAGATSSAGTPIATPPVRWKPWALGGAAALLTILLFAATRGGGSPQTPQSVPAAAAPGEGAPIAPPAALDPRTARDIQHKLDEGEYDKALDRLSRWEDDNGGATPETEELRRQIEDALAAMPPGQRKKKKGKRGD